VWLASSRPKRNPVHSLLRETSTCSLASPTLSQTLASIHSSNLPSESLHASGCLVPQILISAWFGLSEHRKASKQMWKLIQESTSRLSDLNRAVRDLKLSIPAGTRARQFNVRLVDKTMLLKVKNALGRRPSFVDESDQKLGRTQSVDNILADEAGLEIIDMVIGQGKAVKILQEVLLDRVDLSLER
jgi:hypothetical protein